MLYEVVYDPVSGWKPCSIKARVAPGAGSGPPLREHFEVTDSVQGRWLRTGRMLVADRHKLDLTSVAFSVTPTAVLTSDELVQCQGHQGGCSLRLEHHGSPQQQLNFMLDTEDKFYSGFAWETGAASPGRCWLDSAMRDRAVAGRDLEPIFALDSLSRKGASSASIVSAAALRSPSAVAQATKGHWHPRPGFAVLVEFAADETQTCKTRVAGGGCSGPGMVCGGWGNFAARRAIVGQPAASHRCLPGLPENTGARGTILRIVRRPSALGKFRQLLKPRADMESRCPLVALAKRGELQVLDLKALTQVDEVDRELLRLNSSTHGFALGERQRPIGSVAAQSRPDFYLHDGGFTCDRNRANFKVSPTPLAVGEKIDVHEAAPARLASQGPLNNAQEPRRKALSGLLHRLLEPVFLEMHVVNTPDHLGRSPGPGRRNEQSGQTQGQLFHRRPPVGAGRSRDILYPVSQQALKGFHGHFSPRPPENKF